MIHSHYTLPTFRVSRDCLHYHWLSISFQALKTLTDPLIQSSESLRIVWNTTRITRKIKLFFPNFSLHFQIALLSFHTFWFFLFLFLLSLLHFHISMPWNPSDSRVSWDNDSLKSSIFFLLPSFLNLSGTISNFGNFTQSNKS